VSFAVAALYERRSAVPYRAGFDRRYKDQIGPLPDYDVGLVRRSRGGRI